MTHENPDRVKTQLLDAYLLENEEIGTSSLVGAKCLGFYPTLLHSTGDLLFGEVLTSGVNKLMNDQHCRVMEAKRIIDLGMGIGKFCLQLFIQFPHLQHILGIELVPSRVHLAISAVDRWISATPATEQSSFFVERSPTRLLLHLTPTIPVTPLLSATSTMTTPPPIISISTTGKEKSCSKRKKCGEDGNFHQKRHKRRVIQEERKEKDNQEGRFLDYRCGDLFEICPEELARADIVICQTAFLRSSYNRLCTFLDHLKTGTRLVTYHDIATIYREQNRTFKFEKLTINQSMENRFFTTWAPQKGHHFHIWTRL